MSRIYRCANWLALSLLLFSLQPAFAQTMASMEPKPKPKARKVWGNEDVTQLRKPWDEFLEQKKAAEETAKARAQEAQKEQAARSRKQQLKDDPQALWPKTAAEAGKRVAEKLAEIQELDERITRTRQEYFDALSEVEREALQKKINSLTADLEEAQAELRLLQARLAKLKSNPAAPPPQPPAK
ncbi:MAG: hypothetical protein HY234_05910 [Acidobacteria bacterium]|nr:hypothetical protein [Acidobacteriota bacterium]